MFQITLIMTTLPVIDHGPYFFSLTARTHQCSSSSILHRMPPPPPPPPPTPLDPKILLLNIELELKSEKENAEIRLEDPAQYQVPRGWRVWPWACMHAFCTSLIPASPPGTPRVPLLTRAAAGT